MKPLEQGAVGEVCPHPEQDVADRLSGLPKERVERRLRLVGLMFVPFEHTAHVCIGDHNSIAGRFAFEPLSPDYEAERVVIKRPEEGRALCTESGARYPPERRDLAPRRSDALTESRRIGRDDHRRVRRL